MRMNKKCYKQYDTRWASLPYPKKPWLISNCGCGEVSICNAIINMKQYANETPKTIQPYMKQFAESRGHGTYHDGIPTAMKHYGYTDVEEHPTMAKLWKSLKEGDKDAVLLMGSTLGGKYGVRWTGSGHFVQVSDYKKENGKHWVYVKDSASTSSYRTGWISYEDNIRGACLKCWSGKRMKEYKPSKPYTGRLPKGKAGKGDISTNVKAIQQFLNWAINAELPVTGKYKKRTTKAVKMFQSMYGIKATGKFGKKSFTKAYELIADYSGLQPWFDALKTQIKWSKNQKYEFLENPTVKNSKKKGTCITLVAVALQRINLLPSGYYFYLNPNTMRISGNAVSYVKEHKSIFSVSYPHKTVQELWKDGAIKIGDIVGYGNPGYHTQVFMGFNSMGEPLFTSTGGIRRYAKPVPSYADRNIDMIVRIKKVR